MTDTSELAAKMARKKLIEYEFGQAHKKGYKLVRNILSGMLCEIPEDTARCCDPSTELYHSM